MVCFILLFTCLHRLGVRISLPFHIFQQIMFGLSTWMRSCRGKLFRSYYILESVCVQQIEPKTRPNWSPYFLKCYYDQILKCPFFSPDW